jgi:pimeloyl-ACP methyl ester carboxylesterase
MRHDRGVSTGDHLAYDLTGDGPLLVAVHGITENRSYWDPVDLTDGHRVLRVDLRGYGESPHVAPFGIDRSVDDLDEVVRRVADPDDAPPLVVGHSLGGVIATAYAARHPVAGVINIDQPLQVGPLPPEMAGAIRGPGFAEAVRGLFGSFYGELDPAVARDLEERRSYDQEVFTGYWTPLLDWDADALSAWVTAITSLPAGTPYLSLHGNDPGEGYAGWLAQRIPSAVVEDAPARTHYPHLADPDWFVRRLHEFAG